MKHDSNLIWFDLLRGIAAIVVVIGHLRALVFEEFSEMGGNLISYLFYFITGFGHQAVIVFFVLSGFFIIRSIHESVTRGKWKVKEYAINRMTRLWIVLLPALLLTLLWDSLGLDFFQNDYTYSDAIPALPGLNPVDKLGLVNFLGNMFFLQTIEVPTYGTNGPLWSLANEFWYYLSFPVIYFAIINYYKKIIRALLLIVFVASLFYIGREIALYFITWLMGGLAYLLIKKEVITQKSLAVKALSIVILFLIVLAGIRMGIIPLIFNHYSLGIVTAFLLIVLAKVPVKYLFIKNTATFLSNISYTVYLTHFSFAVFLASFLFDQRIEFTFFNFGKYMGILMVILVYSCLVYYIFERNTASVKSFIKKGISK